MSKSALITGITGQDGSYLAELLLSEGYEVYGLVRRTAHQDYRNLQGIMGRISILEGDLTDESSLVNALSVSQPDEVYNLAAQSFVKASFSQPVSTCETNAIGVVKLLEAVRTTCPSAKVYQASTSELFGNTKICPQNELTPFQPRSPYGYSKLLAYWAIVNVREAYNVFACNGILMNHESERRPMEFVTRKITDGVARIAHGLQDSITLGTLDTRRDWGYAPDYVEAMHLMLQQKTPEDFVIATGVTHTIADFCEAAFAWAGIDDWESRVKLDAKFTRPSDVNLLCGDATKAKEVLGWEPKTSFSELVAKMVTHDMDRYENL